MIRANYKERFGKALKNVGSGRVPEMWDPGEYREGRNPGEYQKRWDPGEYRKCGIRASTRNVGSGRLPER